jgi:hypothetical protein
VKGKAGQVDRESTVRYAPDVVAAEEDSLVVDEVEPEDGFGEPSLETMGIELDASRFGRRVVVVRAL